MSAYLERMRAGMAQYESAKRRYAAVRARYAGPDASFLADRDPCSASAVAAAEFWRADVQTYALVILAEQAEGGAR